ncbi:helix-turn-helix domain-containing protein [Rhizobium herbae]|uniref:Helix-turn-helix domain-containing protein n=1 Tax=Rhizobium herbae TaxID=508661 RepID=A0ABS7H5H8_9HYPH|nr:helix-turn-helix domain-containing protein [Rhizobium herbae]
MSNARFSIIPAWIVTDTRLKGGDLRVLCLLGSFTNKEGWCRRSQVKMAEELGCGRSTVQASLNRLYQVGVVEKREVDSIDGRDSAHYYRVILDRKVSDAMLAAFGDEAEEFHPNSTGSDETPPATIVAPPATSGMAPPAIPGVAPINDTSLTTPSNEEREPAGEDLKKIEAAGWKLLKDWPGFDGMPKKPALGFWMRLSVEERQMATDRFPAWLALLKAQKKSHVPAPSTYFAERLWQNVPSMQEATKPKNVMAGPYGKLWQATRLSDLLAGATGPISALTATERMMIADGKLSMDGVIAEKRRKMGWPTVNTMHERARNAQGWLCPLALEDAAHGFHQVHRDGELFKAWKREHERRNWPFLDEGRLPEWIYFPAIDEDHQQDLDTAVRDALDRFSQITGTFQQRGKGHDDAA